MKYNKTRTYKPNKMRALRILKGVSIQEFADNVGISVSSARKYECNLRRPKDEVKKAICQYYDVSVEYLFYDHEQFG